MPIQTKRKSRGKALTHNLGTTQGRVVKVMHPLKSPSTHHRGDWMGPTTSLDGEKKISYPHQVLNPRPASPQQVAIPTTLPQPHNINPFQSNFSANRILSSSYLFWVGNTTANTMHNHLFTSKHMACQETERVQPALFMLAKVRTIWGKTSDRFWQRSGRNKNVSDVCRHRSGTGKS